MTNRSIILPVGICIVFFFTQCTSVSKQQNPVAPISVEEGNNTDTIGIETKVTDNQREEEDDTILRHYTEDDGYTDITERLYPDTDMQQVYKKKVRKIEKLLREELPENNLNYKIETDSIILEVTYTYKDKNHLEIELFYPGGTTYVDMIRQGKDVKVIEKYCAD